MFTKKSIILPLLATLSILPPLLGGWENPTTKGRPAFIFEVGPGFLVKGKDSKVSVLYQVDGSGNLTDPFGNTQRVGYEVGVGLRALAQVMANNKESVEFIYTGLFNWTRQKGVSNTSTGVGVLTAPYTTTDWQSADKITWSSKTSYNSYDATMWWHLTPRYEDYFSFSLLAGARSINISDEDLFFSFKTLTAKPSQLKAISNNWLVGGEVGFEIYCRPLSFIAWAVQFRGAVLSDGVTRSIYLTDLANSTVVANTDDDDARKIAGMGEAIPYIVLQNNKLYAKLLGSITYIGNISSSATSFKKTRKITDIKFSRKFLIAGAFLDIGYVF